MQYVTPYRGTLLLALLLMLGESVASLASPWLAGQFAQTLLGDETPMRFSINTLLLVWLGILAIQGVLRFANRYLLANIGEQMLVSLRLRLYDHLQSLPLTYFHERKRGETLSLLTNDVGAISQFVTGTLLGLLPLLVLLIGALFMIYHIDPLIALLAGGLIPLFYFIMKLLGRRIRPLSGAMMDQYGKTFAIVEENLNLLPIIKSFTREPLESSRFEASNTRLSELIRQYQRIQSLLSPVIQFLAAAGVLLLLWISSGQLQAGHITTGELISLLLYGMLLTRPVSSLADAYGQIQYTRGAAQRLIEVFATQPEPLDAGSQSLPPVRGDIEFDNVSFSYPDRNITLNGLNLSIQAGETIAITGENGAGKSTLVHLLMRFIEPQSGHIRIDGHDITTVNLSSLRQQIGLVQQHILLLNGSIRDNIAFGHIEADDAAIEQAARAAHALAFVQALPDGFDTIIGDQGIKLSGGQKQRLALARALLVDPPILVLDEATAMFDPEGERGFIEECHELLSQRTVILITHRPASLALADRILKMESGYLSQSIA